MIIGSFDERGDELNILKSSCWMKTNKQPTIQQPAKRSNRSTVYEPATPSTAPPQWRVPTSTSKVGSSCPKGRCRY